jgi:hypothetical protein
MDVTDGEEQGLIAQGNVLCNECRTLLDSFVAAVHELVVLNQTHSRAVLNGKPDPHGFELLIRAANEKKQNAKYACLQHRDTHGGPGLREC